MIPSASRAPLQPHEANVEEDPAPDPVAASAAPAQTYPRTHESGPQAPTGAAAVHHAIVRALQHDPETPPAIVNALRQWSAADQAQADRFTQQLVELFRELSVREQISPDVFDEQVLPSLAHAAVLLVSAGLGDPSDVTQALRMSFLHDECVVDSGARLGRAATSACVAAVTFAVLNTLRFLLHDLPQLTQAQIGELSPASHLYRSSPMRAAGATLAEATADRVMQACVLSRRAVFNNPLAVAVARRRGMDLIGERNLRTASLALVSFLTRGLAVPLVAAAWGAMPNVPRWWLDTMLALTAEMLATLSEGNTRLHRFNGTDYALLLLSQRDLALRLDHLASLGQGQNQVPDAPGWFANLRATLAECPRPSTLLQGLMLLAGLALDAWLVVDQPSPIGRGPTPTEPRTFREYMECEPIDPADVARLGWVSTGLTAIGTFAALTVHAHAPAIDARVAAITGHWRARIASLTGRPAATPTSTDPTPPATPPHFRMSASPGASAQAYRRPPAATASVPPMLARRPQPAPTSRLTTARGLQASAAVDLAVDPASDATQRPRHGGASASPSRSRPGPPFDRVG